GAVVFHDDFDLLAGDGVAVLLHVELHRRLDLLARRGLLARERDDEAHLDLRERRARQQRAERHGRSTAHKIVNAHAYSPSGFAAFAPRLAAMVLGGSASVTG